MLDADSSQRRAIDAVLAGRSLVIHGPPGTGKSQTIANLIATLVARGRKVLFVAEKRAAIDAVLSRLKGVGLGDMVLDIHEGTRDRLRIARDLGDTLDGRSTPRRRTLSDLHRRLVDRQQRLSQHVTALHEVHQPWGLTPFEVQAALLGIPAEARTPVRLAAPERLDAGGGRPDPRRAARVRPPGRVHPAPGQHAVVRRRAPHRRRGAPGPRAGRQAGLRDAADARCTGSSAARAGLRRREDYAAQAGLMRLFAGIAQTLHAFDPAVYASSARVAGRRHRRRGRARPARTPALREQARVAVDRAGRAQALREELPAALDAAASQLAQWRELGEADRPAAAACRLPAAEPAVRGVPPASWPRCARSSGAARARRRR